MIKSDIKVLGRDAAIYLRRAGHDEEADAVESLLLELNAAASETEVYGDALRRRDMDIEKLSEHAEYLKQGNDADVARWRAVAEGLGGLTLHDLAGRVEDAGAAVDAAIAERHAERDDGDGEPRTLLGN